jgi:hypothetical protein
MSRKNRSDIVDATVEEPTAQEQPQADNGAARARRNGETKAQKFRRIANRRLAKAVKTIRTLIPLANRSQYDSGPAEFQVIQNELVKACGQVKAAFERTAVVEETVVYFR